MIAIRCALLHILGVAAFFGCAAAALPSHVSATTGPVQFLPAPLYTIATKVAQLYTGQYVVKSVASASRLRDGAMGIEINSSNGALYGLAQFYGYDASGKGSTWVGTLYNFKQTGKNAISLQIVAPTGKPVLGTMSVQRAATGDLSGTIQLAGHGYAISWHKLSR